MTETVPLDIVKIVIADDHLLLAQSLADVLQRHEQISVLKLASNGSDLLVVLEALSEKVNMVLLDIGMPGMDGLTVLPIIRQRFDWIKILVLSSHDDGEYVNSIIQNGAHGYVLKSNSAENLLQSILKVHAGERVLSLHLTDQMIDHLQLARVKKCPSIKKITDRERDVLDLLAQGMTCQGAAAKLYIAESTVITHKRNLFKKLKVHNTAGLIRTAMEAGLI